MMRPLSEFSLEERRRIRVVLFDIDDTLTANGLLPSASLAALEALSAAGMIVIPVTGRPAGWCDHFARMWPVDAVVGENGALYFSYNRDARKMTSGYAKTFEERQQDRSRLNDLRARILTEVPGAGIASDQDYRIADLAIDFCEDVDPLPSEQVARIVAIFAAAGATAKVSSIHVNGWFGDYDKLSMTGRCLRELFEIEPRAHNEQIVFVGDSPNDAPMFAFFKNSVGVANVRHANLSAEPTWVTRGESAVGFRELAAALLEVKTDGTNSQT